MKQTDYKFYTGLKVKSISFNKTPKTVKDSAIFNNLFKAGILIVKKAGRGTNIVIDKQNDYDNFLQMTFPSDNNLSLTKLNNIKQFKNSKARRTKELAMFFLRGFKEISINGKKIDLGNYTESFGFFGLTNALVKCENICFVENKNTFLNAEKLLGKDWVYIHSYGRVGLEVLKSIYCDEVTVFVDYDFNGLDEYLRIKKHFKNAKLIIPNNFKELFDTYGCVLKGKQKASKQVSESEISEVAMIRELVRTSNKFLEQEILIND